MFREGLESTWKSAMGRDEGSISRMCQKLGVGDVPEESMRVTLAETPSSEGYGA